MEPSELAEVLEKGEELFSTQRWRDLNLLVAAIPEPEREAELLLSYFFAFTEWELGRELEARRELPRLIQRGQKHRGTKLFRRIKLFEAVTDLMSGDLKQAETALSEVLEAAHSAADPHYVSLAELNMGVIYDCYAKPDRALICYHRSLTHWITLGRFDQMGCCYHNMGMAYRQMEMLEKAESHFRLAATYQALWGHETFQVIISEICRAHTMLLIGDIQLAEIVIEAALCRAQEYGHQITVGEALHVRGMVRAMTSRRAESLRDLRAALRIARTYNAKNLRGEIHATFSTLPLGITEKKRMRHYEVAIAIFTRIGWVSQILRLQKSFLQLRKVS